MKAKYKIILILFLIFVSYWIYLSFQPYIPMSQDEIDIRINYLERVINEPLDQNSEIFQIGKESSAEFMLFSYAYSTYAFTNLIVVDSSYKERLAPLIKRSIKNLLTKKISFQYDVSIDILLTSDSIPNFSVLYLGHLNLMIGCYRLVSGDNTYNLLNDKISASLYKRYNETPFLLLESYPQAIWIADNTVALTSLKLYSNNTKNEYDTICYKWVEYVKEYYLEARTGVFYSTVNSITGKPEEEPRGAMLGWSIMFIYQFDSEFSLQLYNNYKKYFSDNFFALRLFRERSNSRTTSMGDIDSGPILLGYSIPANEFILGAAIAAKDYETAAEITRLIGFGTLKEEKNNELKYSLRFVPMNISPMAEALVLNSLTMTRWVE